MGLIIVKQWLQERAMTKLSTIYMHHTSPYTGVSASLFGSKYRTLYVTYYWVGKNMCGIRPLLFFKVSSQSQHRFCRVVVHYLELLNWPQRERERWNREKVGNWIRRQRASLWFARLWMRLDCECTRALNL